MANGSYRAYLLAPLQQTSSPITRLAELEHFGFCDELVRFHFTHHGESVDVGHSHREQRSRLTHVAIPDDDSIADRSTVI